MITTKPPTTGPVAGVDTHADTHTLAVVTAQGAVEFTEQFTADQRGYTALLRRLQEIEGLATVGVEGTNSYGAELTRVLLAAGLTVLEVLRPTRQVRRMDGKSDPVDAIAAARQVLTGDGTSTPKDTDSPVEALRYLLTARRNLVRAASRILTVIRSLLVTAPESVRAPLRDLNDPALITRLAACRPGSDMADPATAAKHSLKLLARDYQRLNTEAGGLEDQMTQLVTTINPALLEVFGSGTITSAQLLVTAGDNPERIATEAQFAHLCGAAPIPASSGKTRRFRLNRGGDRQANAALHRIALVRMSHDPRTRAYVERRTNENRSKKEILRCLKRAIAREIHRVLLAPEINAPVDLRSLRHKKRITLTQAAEALETQPARLSEIERHTRPLRELTSQYESWLAAA